MKRYILAVAAAMFAPAPLLAQATVSTSSCELHVWPGAGLSSVYSGWFHGGIVNGAVKGRDGYPVIPAEPISTQNQIELLGRANVPQLLNLPDHRVVLHDEALPSRTIRTTVGRVLPETAPCYAELIVDSVFFQQDVVDGSFLKILFRYRDFGTEPTPRRVFGTWVKTRLLLLPPKPGADEAAAAEELRAAFTNDVTLFAAALLKPPKDRKSG